MLPISTYAGLPVHCGRPGRLGRRHCGAATGPAGRVCRVAGAAVGRPPAGRLQRQSHHCESFECVLSTSLSFLGFSTISWLEHIPGRLDCSGCTPAGHLHRQHDHCEPIRTPVCAFLLAVIDSRLPLLLRAARRQAACTASPITSHFDNFAGFEAGTDAGSAHEHCETHELNALLLPQVRGRFGAAAESDVALKCCHMQCLSACSTVLLIVAIVHAAGGRDGAAAVAAVRGAVLCASCAARQRVRPGGAPSITRPGDNGFAFYKRQEEDGTAAHAPTELPPSHNISTHTKLCQIRNRGTEELKSIFIIYPEQ